MNIRHDSILIWSLVQELCNEAECTTAHAFFGGNMHHSCMEIELAPFRGDGQMSVEISVVPRRFNPDMDGDPATRNDVYLLEVHRGKGKSMTHESLCFSREDAKAFLLAEINKK